MGSHRAAHMRGCSSICLNRRSLDKLSHGLPYCTGLGESQIICNLALNLMREPIFFYSSLENFQVRSIDFIFSLSLDCLSLVRKCQRGLDLSLVKELISTLFFKLVFASLGNNLKPTLSHILHFSKRATKHVARF